MKSPLQVLNHSLVIAWKDLTEFRRNRITLIFSLIMPIMMMGMFGYIFQDSASALNNVPVGIIVDDLGIYGEQISTMISDISSDSNSIRLVEFSTRTQAEEKIFSSEIKAVIIIPQNFSSSIQSQTQTKIIIVLDPSNPAIAQSFTQFFNSVINVISDQFSQELIETGMPSLNSEFILTPISTSVESIVSGGGSSFDFVAPGIIAMNVMMSGLTALGAALARERESGTLDGILMSPISRTSIILGKTVSHTIRNLFQGGITIAIAVLIFGVTIRGNPLLIVFILILGTISFLGLGIIATAIAKEQESAQLILGLLQFPMMFLSGVLFPIEQMPPILQTVSKVLPLTYAVEALRKVMILGVGFEAIILPITILVILGVVTMTLGVPLFERAVKK
ncbi:MAG: ABC transporter permease [Candidatus Heimdallarchaeota archaeon]|nr:ABC transporter permease [Candidatus Heimdallarchaeota archaeon]